MLASWIAYLPLFLLLVCTFFAVYEAILTQRKRKQARMQEDFRTLKASFKPKRESFENFVLEWKNKIQVSQGENFVEH